MPRTLARRHTAAGGFSLIELMVVVTITGILAALAIPAFIKYKYRARAWQAEEVLQNIAVREEAFRAEFGTYLAVVDGCPAATYNPGLDDKCFYPDASTVGLTSAPFPTGNDFETLGVDMNGHTYFGYAVMAGTPADTSPFTTAPTPPGLSPDFWWVAQAKSDLDGTYPPVTFEYTSQSRRIWCSSKAGYD